MNRTVTVAPVRKSINVAAAPDCAFQVSGGNVAVVDQEPQHQQIAEAE
jgi:hypothetical protein